jgi:hypothetical protein
MMLILILSFMLEVWLPEVNAKLWYAVWAKNQAMTKIKPKNYR